MCPRGWQLVQQMFAAGMSLSKTTLTSVLVALYRHDDVDAATTLFRTVQQHGMPFDLSHHALGIKYLLMPAVASTTSVWQAPSHLPPVSGCISDAIPPLRQLDAKVALQQLAHALSPSPPSTSSSSSSTSSSPATSSAAAATASSSSTSAPRSYSADALVTALTSSPVLAALAVECLAWDPPDVSAVDPHDWAGQALRRAEATLLRVASASVITGGSSPVALTAWTHLVTRYAARRQWNDAFR